MIPGSALYVFLQREATARQWTQETLGEQQRETSEQHIQSWRRPAVEREGGGGAKRPAQREAPSTRSRPVSVRTSAKGAHARSAGGEHLPAPAHQEHMQGVRGGRASASTIASRADARSAGGRAPCPHQRERSICKECEGASICEHQRQRSICKECGGTSICPYQRERSQCKEWRGASIYQHQRQRSQCKECGDLPAPALSPA